MPQPSYGVSSYGNMVISYGSNNSAQLFKINRNELQSQGKGVEQIHQCSFGQPTLNDLPISPPEKMIRSTRIVKAAFEPCQFDPESGDAPVRRLMSINASNAMMYDIPTGRVIGQEAFGNKILSSLSFSLHAPFGSLLAVGNKSSGVSIIDSRLLQQGSNSVVWSINDAHNGEVSDVEFNTFIPYWLATSGEDGVIKLWDIRYLKGSAARIDGHYSGITSLAWSNTHCEVLATGSKDRSVKIWNFDHEKSMSKMPVKEFMIGCPNSDLESCCNPHLPEKSVIGSSMLGNCTNFSSPLVAIAADPCHSGTFVAATALGIVSTHTVRSKIFESTLKHRYDNSYEREVERLVQSRHLNEAYETMVKLSRGAVSKDNRIAEHEGELIKYCSTRPAIMPDEWSIASKDVINNEEVRKDLKNFSYGLPPNFGQFPQWLDIISDFGQIQFGLVLLRHQVTSEVKNGNWEIILQKEKSIIAGMGVDDEFMDIDTLSLIVETLLMNRYMKGMSIGLALGQLLADVPRFKFETLAEIIGLLVFPTVYDSLEWIPENLMEQKASERQEYVKKFILFAKEERPVSSQMFAKEERPVSSQSQTVLTSVGLMGSRSHRSRTVNAQNMPKPIKSDENNGYIKISRKQINAILGDAKKALPMVSLEIRLIKLIESPPDDYNEEIIHIMQNVLTDSGVGGSRTKAGVVPFEKTISAFSNRLYLNALLETKRYEEYFGVAIHLISVRGWI
jgi:hypothetical protein